jgi:hypothetical protein
MLSKNREAAAGVVVDNGQGEGPDAAATPVEGDGNPREALVMNDAASTMPPAGDFGLGPARGEDYANA